MLTETDDAVAMIGEKYKKISDFASIKNGAARNRGGDPPWKKYAENRDRI